MQMNGCTAVWISYLNDTLPNTFRRVKSRSTFWPIFLLLIPGIVNSYSGRL
jgi:hypothetical protein